MFPLTKKEIIRGFQDHIAAGLGGATDYAALYVPYYAPKDGWAYEPYPWSFRRGTGGWWTGLRLVGGQKIEGAHMSKVFVSKGFVKEGTLMGITGGYPPRGKEISSGPHLHVQIIEVNGKRYDPELFPWGKEKPLIERVNEALRAAGSIVEPIRQRYWADRVAAGDKTTFEDLTNGIRFRMQNRLMPHQDGR
jgi:hypothetical protein